MNREAQAGEDVISTCGFCSDAEGKPSFVDGCPAHGQKRLATDPALLARDKLTDYTCGGASWAEVYLTRDEASILQRTSYDLAEAVRLLHVVVAWHWTPGNEQNTARVDALYPGRGAAPSRRGPLFRAIEKLLERYPYGGANQ